MTEKEETDFVDPADEVREFVKKEMRANDASHDWSHIERVCENGHAIGVEEHLGTELLLVELACLLHDVKDWKYHGTEVEKGRYGAPRDVERCLQQIGFAESVIDCICFVVANVGFSKQLEKREEKEKEKGEEEKIPQEWIRVLHVVQDADQLDALGAIGIARCLTFGAVKGRALYDPAIQVRGDISALSAEEYRKGKTTTMNHFSEKLFHLKRLMKTDAGRKMAEQRDAFMREFYTRFYDEVNGTA